MIRLSSNVWNTVGHYCFAAGAASTYRMLAKSSGMMEIRNILVDECRFCSDYREKVAWKNRGLGLVHDIVDNSSSPDPRQITFDPGSGELDISPYVVSGV